MTAVWCSRLNWVPSKFIIHAKVSNSPGPQNVTVFAERVFKEVIKVNGVIRRVLTNMTGVLMRRGGEDTGDHLDTQAEAKERGFRKTEACGPWVLDLQPLDL